MSSPSVLFLLPDVPTPNDRVRTTWRAVELLVGEGVDAAVWHQSSGYRPGWFESDAPVVYGAEQTLRDDHVIVVPEVLVVDGHDPAPGGRVVIFNQDALATVENVPTGEYPAWTSDAMLWSTSESGAALLTEVLPGSDVAIAPPWIDTDRFRPRSRQATRRVVYAAGRGSRTAKLIASMLRRVVPDWELVAVDDATEDERSDVLGTSDLYLALDGDEASQAFVAEAVASGCHVVSYGTAPASEDPILGPRWSTTVPVGDPRVLVATVADIVGRIKRGEFLTDAGAGRHLVEERFNRSDAAARLVKLVDEARSRRAEHDVRAEHPTVFLERNRLPTSFDLRATIEDLRAQNRNLLEMVAIVPELRKHHGEALATVSDLRGEIELMRAEIAAAEHVAATAHELAIRVRTLESSLATRDDALRRRIRDLETSTSWKVTAPLRWASGQMRPR